MDPIVKVPQARGCCLIQGSITIWPVLVANCVFLGVFLWIWALVCLSASACMCYCVSRQIITMVTALFGCSHVMWHRLTPPHEHVKLHTDSFENLLSSITQHHHSFKGISTCWLLDASCVTGGGWISGLLETVCPNLNLCKSSQNNEICLKFVWNDTNFRSIHFQLCLECWRPYPVSEHTLFQGIWAMRKTSLWKVCKEKDSTCQNGSRPVDYLTGNLTASEGGSGLESQQ